MLGQYRGCTAFMGLENAMRNEGGGRNGGSVVEHRHAEALVREFLLFRGFTHTLRAFEAELAADVTQGYQVDRIMELLFNAYVPRYEINKLVELMAFLSRTLFSPADARCQGTARKLDAALRKYYIVHALQKGRVDRVVHFFEQYGDTVLQSGEDWQAWFAIPYVKNPSTDPRFQVYFTKEWLDTLMVSFRNFLSQFFDGIRLPTLLKLMSKRSDCRAVKQELEELQEKCSLLGATLQGKEEEILKLKRDLSSLQTSQRSKAQPAEPSSISEASNTEDSEFTLTAEKIHVEGSTTSSASLEVYPSRNLQEQTTREAQERASDNDTSIATSVIDETAGAAATWPKEEDYAEVIVASQESFSGHTSLITRCRFSSTGSNIASASVDGTVRIWTYDSTASTSRNATIYCGAEIMSLDWEHKSGRLLLLGTAERGIKAWNVDAKRVVCDLSTNSAFPRVLDLKCSPTDPVFVSAESSIGTGTDNVEPNYFGSLTVWNMRNWKAVDVLPLGEDPPVVTSICFNHNGKMVAAAANDGMIRLFDMNGCLPITGWPAHDGCSVNCVRFAPNQTSIFTMGSDGQVFEWSLHNQGQILQSYDASKFTSGDGTKFPRHEMALATHGNSLLLTSNLQYAPLFNFGGKPKAQRTLEHNGPITSVDWHPHLNMYLTGSADHSIHVTSIA